MDIFKSSFKDLDKISSHDFSGSLNESRNGNTYINRIEDVDPIHTLINNINNVSIKSYPESKFDDNKRNQKISNIVNKINLTDNILKAFDDMNADFFYLEHMLIPIVPNTQQKLHQFDI